MITQSIVLSNWTNGVIVIAIFGLVCLVLIGYLIKFIATSDKKKENPKDR